MKMDTKNIHFIHYIHFYLSYSPVIRP